MVMLFAGELLWQNDLQGPVLSFSLIQLLLLCSHLSLLDFNKGRGRFVRFLLLFPTLYLVFDLACNPHYSFGSSVRDTAWGVLSWHLLAKSLDIGLVYSLEGRSAPRWCVPEWDKEEIKENGEHQSENSISSSNDRKLAIWERTPMSKRPRWAIKSNCFPLNWKLLPLPTRPVDQLIWSIDVMTLRRPGTSYLYPNEMRALEWSQKRLETAAQAQRRYNRSTLKTQSSPLVTPFGYSETPLIDALLQVILVAWAVNHITTLNIPASKPGGFYGLPMSKQLSITLALGTLIAFPGDLPELAFIPLLQRWPFYAPCTSIIPNFRSVARSKSLTDMWGVRWHAFSKRDFIRLGLLFPIGSKIRALTVLKTFLWSAVLHSFMFARVCNEQSPRRNYFHFLVVFYNPGSYALFLGQGCLVILENATAPILMKSGLYKRVKSSTTLSIFLSCLQSLYVYGSIIWMARWFVAELITFNFFTQEAIQSLSLQSLWTDNVILWQDRWRQLSTLLS